MGFRFTKENIEKTLMLNNGYSDVTNYDSKNLRETRTYTIKDDKLVCHSEGKASIDGHFDEAFDLINAVSRRAVNSLTPGTGEVLKFDDYKDSKEKYY